MGKRLVVWVRQCGNLSQLGHTEVRLLYGVDPDGDETYSVWVSGAVTGKDFPIVIEKTKEKVNDLHVWRQITE